MAALLGHNIALPPILALGSEEMKRRVLPRVLSGEKRAALCITEPGGGSDVAAVTTSAVKDGDDYVLNGSKTFITSGMEAEYMTVAVRTGGAGAGGVSLILVDANTPGVTRTELPKTGVSLLFEPQFEWKSLTTHHKYKNTLYRLAMLRYGYHYI